MDVTIRFEGTFRFSCVESEQWIDIRWGEEWELDNPIFGNMPIEFGGRSFSFSPVYRRLRGRKLYAECKLKREEEFESIELMAKAAMDFAGSVAPPVDIDWRWVEYHSDGNLPEDFRDRWHDNLEGHNLRQTGEDQIERVPFKERARK
jgi:hypothetical protein